MGVKGIKTGPLISGAERKKLKKLGLTIRTQRTAKGWRLEDVKQKATKELGNTGEK